MCFRNCPLFPTHNRPCLNQRQHQHTINTTASDRDYSISLFLQWSQEKAGRLGACEKVSSGCLWSAPTLTWQGLLACNTEILYLPGGLCQRIYRTGFWKLQRDKTRCEMRMVKCDTWWRMTQHNRNSLWKLIIRACVVIQSSWVLQENETQKRFKRLLTECSGSLEITLILTVEEIHT